MALLTVQQMPQGGTITYGAANASDTVRPDGDRVFVVYKNTNAATRTIGVSMPAGFDRYGATHPDPSYALAATTGETWVPVYPDMADPVTGLVTLTPSATTNVTVAAIRR